MNDRDRALSALHALDPGCPRDEWVTIGMAAKDAGLTCEDYTDWSSGAANFKGERDCAAAWRSFRPGAVKAATLFSRAFAAGWNDPTSRRVNGHAKHANGSGGTAHRRKVNGAPRPAIAAAEAWAQCEPATEDHGYIRAKAGRPEGLRVVPADSHLTIAGERMAGWLVVPALDASGTPASLQFIPPPEATGKKKLNLPGAPMAGTFTVGIVEAGGTAHLVEGIATAWACWKATGHAAVVCFGWGLVKARAKEIRERNPSAELVIVPDVGKESGAAAIAYEVGAKVATMPEGWPQNSDVADLGLRDGFDAVESVLLAAKTPPEPEPRYRLLTSADLHALPPLAWRIRSVLPAEGLASIFGPSSSGKSFLALDMAASIGAGRDWFGCRVNAAPVVYCALEGEAGIRSRVKAWEIREGAAMLVRLILQSFKLTELQDVQDLAAAIVRGVGPGAVIFLDTLNRAAPTADENSSRDMGAILEACKEVQRLTSGLVVLVHHTGKDATKGLRGHSSLFAALDAAIELTRSGNRREWLVAKSKDGEDGAAHPFKLRVVELGTDASGQAVTSCVVAPDSGVTEVNRAKVPQGGNQRLVWDALGPLFVKGRTGVPGAPAHRPCVELEAAIPGVAGRLTCAPERRTERTREAITGLVSRGLLGCNDGWLWVV